MPAAVANAGPTTSPAAPAEWELLPAHEGTVRRTMVPREGQIWLLAFAGLWLVGWMKGINLILLLAYLLFFLWALNWFVARRSLWGLRAGRRWGEAVFAGAATSWQAAVVNVGRRPQNGWLLLDEGPGHTVRWFIGRIGVGERARLRRDVVLPRRGRYECPPLRAVSSFPFGLVRQEVTFGDCGAVTVLPQLGTLHIGRLRRWLAQTARPDERARRTRRRLAHEVEFQGLRAFHPGDSPRWIHWRTSARRGELMVREFDQGTHHDLVLLLEPFAEAEPSAALEAAVSLAATICWAWTHGSDDRVVLAIAGEEPIVVAGFGGTGQDFLLLETLAGVKRTLRPNLAGLQRKLLDVPLPLGPALLVTSRRNSGAAEELSRRLDRPVAGMEGLAPPSFYHPPELVPENSQGV
jgi:uncharacterized protein (DUF58 family)